MLKYIVCFTCAKNQGFKYTFDLYMRSMNNLPGGLFYAFFTCICDLSLWKIWALYL